MPSVMQRIGTPNARHNIDNAYRAKLENVDPELSKYNEIIRIRSIEKIYQEIFRSRNVFPWPVGATTMAEGAGRSSGA